MVDEHYLTEEATIGRTQFRLAIGIAIALIATGVLATPFAGLILPSSPGYMAGFGAATITVDLLLAALLFSKRMADHTGDSVRLGEAYLYAGVVAALLIAATPEELTAATFMGAPASAIWMWTFWHTGFGLTIIRYAWSSNRANIQSVSIANSIMWVVGIALSLAVAAMTASRYLPQLLSTDQANFSSGGLVIPAIVLSTNIMAFVAVVRLGLRTPDQLWVAVGMIAACFDVWLSVRGSSQYALGWYIARLDGLLTSLFVLISNIHGLAALYKNLANANRLLLTLDNKDGMTGLLNKTSFDEILNKEWRRAQREGNALALLMIDIDFFKRYNDLYGHLQGDDCLRKVATQLQVVAQRPGDVAFRYEGEKFTVILPSTGSNGASRVANRILSNITSLALPHTQNPPLQLVSASIGIASIIPESDLTMDDLMSAADRGLSQAKAAGRNQAQVADCRMRAELTHALG